MCTKSYNSLLAENISSSVMVCFLSRAARVSDLQKECMKYLKEAFSLTREQLVVGKTGKEMDAPVRKYFEKHGLSKYLVCPFIHTIGLHEAESPFFGPHSNDVLTPSMTVCIDISFFGHPEFNGVRIETGYEITEKGPKPFSPYIEKEILR